jgi:tripartite-type tricarboxylate transporter receptor subunit TctC
MSSESTTREINAALSDPVFKARIAEMGSAALIGTPAEFGRLIADETDKWARVIKFAAVKTE